MPNLITSLIEPFKAFSKKEWLLLALIFVIGLGLRLYPGKDHYIWSYDQARDAYETRSILEQGDLKLVGPQTEFVGLRHGVLSYYLLAPWYFLSAGDPNLPALFMTIFHLSSLVPIFLLSQALFKDKRISFLASFLFAVAYQQIEYARWLSNISIVTPLLAWFYYFTWRVWSQKKSLLKLSFVAAFFLSLAIQGEFFLIFLVPLTILTWLNQEGSWQKAIGGSLGLIVGTSSMWLAEIKFGFLGAKTFFNEFIGGQSNTVWSAHQALSLYLNHLGLVVQQNIFGLNTAMGLLFLVLLLFSLKCFWSKKENKQLKYLLILFFAHSLLFTLNPIDAVFLDLTTYIPLFILSSYLIVRLFAKKAWWGVLVLICLIGSQSLQLASNVQNKTPFQNYNFIQTGILFSQKMELVEEIYSLTADEDFTLSVLGTPYGVQTVWASIFEQYLARHPQAKKPTWYGQRALGYPADTFFEKVDAPAQKHIFLIEANQELISEYIRDQVLAKQNQETVLQEEVEFYGYKIQLRTPRQQKEVLK